MECRLRQELDPQGVLVLNIMLEEEVRLDPQDLLVLNISLEEEVRGAEMFRSSSALVCAHF